jgi:hypothetical protein
MEVQMKRSCPVAALVENAGPKKSAPVLPLRAVSAGGIDMEAAILAAVTFSARKELFMRLRVLLALSLSVLLFATALPAEDKNPDKQAVKKVDYSQIAQAGPGVYKVEFDKHGRIQSCIVAGSSRISTVLGAAKGLEVARQRAELRAKAEFIKWLKEKVSVYQKSDDETILFLEGNEDNDKNARHESGKAVEKTTAQFTIFAEGLARGLQVVHVEVNSNDKEYILILKWKSKTAAAVKEVQRDLNTDAKDEGKEPEKKKDGRPDSKKIRDKKVTIDDD